MGEVFLAIFKKMALAADFQRHQASTLGSHGFPAVHKNKELADCSHITHLSIKNRPKSHDWLEPH